MKTTLSLLLLGLAGAALAQPPDLDAMLRNADRYRLGGAVGSATVAADLQVETRVESFHADGKVDKERRYTVFTQSDRRSLVLMQSPAEKGQKVLMLGDDFWLLMPQSQRPMRITPMQKLLGEASTGDIATLGWHQDYNARWLGEVPCAAARPETLLPGPREATAGAPAPTAVCHHLELQARRKGVTYQRIELWLGHVHHEPVRADLYVQSDRLAKQARFELDRAPPQGVVTVMWLTDRLGNGRQTRVSYLSRRPRTVPAEWLNPMFLARQPNLE